MTFPARTLATMLLLPLLLLLLAPAHAQLQLYRAGPITTPLQTLSSGDVICPSDYPSGLAIRCVALESDTLATFRVDGVVVRKERRKPFFLSGDAPGVARPWAPPAPPATLELECVLASATHAVTLSIACAAPSSPSPSASASLASPVPPSPTASPSAPVVLGTPVPSGPPMHEPAAMYFVRTDAGVGAPGAPSVKLVKNLSFCPLTALGTATEFTVYCAPSGASTAARFKVNGAKVRWDGTMPFFITRDVAGSPAPWAYPPGPFKIQCILNDGVKKFVANVQIACPSPVATPLPSVTATGLPSVSPAASPAMADPSASPVAAPSPSGSSQMQRDAEGCVIIPAKGVPLTPGWTEDVDGLTFMAGNMSRKVTKKDVASLEYTFTAVRSGRHAVVVDMTTRGNADYNDIWVGMPPGGLQLMKNGVAVRKKGLIKGYHNINGRAALIGSVDHNTHSISSWDMLEAGQEYQFIVGGRSNRLTLHRIILFVCEGEGCQRWPWRATQDICAPGSSVY